MRIRKDGMPYSLPSNWIEFTPEMEWLCRGLYQVMTNQELADFLNVKITWLRGHLYKAGMLRMELEYWTDVQVAFLKRNFRKIGDKELAEIFNTKWPKHKGWTHKHIEKKRKYLKLHRTKKQIKAIHQRNVDAGRFLLCPVKRWLVTGVAAEGEIRMWREHGGRFIPRIKVNGKFIHWARWAWEKHHGAIPEKMNVVFKDNNPNNYTIENLELLSDADLARRNVAKSSRELSDNYVAGILTHHNPELRQLLKDEKTIINLKRNQLLLQRTVKQKANGKE